MDQKAAVCQTEQGFFASGKEAEQESTEFESQYLLLAIPLHRRRPWILTASPEKCLIYFLISLMKQHFHVKWLGNVKPRKYEQTLQSTSALRSVKS